nr:hypothetical protein CFP56_72198 [Quercus suber]
MDTSNFSPGSEKQWLIRDQDGFGDTEVHMGESKELEISANGTLTDLVVSVGDSHVINVFEISNKGELSDLAISEVDSHMLKEFGISTKGEIADLAISNGDSHVTSG